MADIPCITTVQGLGAAVQGIEALRARRDRRALAAGLGARRADAVTAVPSTRCATRDLDRRGRPRLTRRRPGARAPLRRSGRSGRLARLRAGRAGRTGAARWG